MTSSEIKNIIHSNQEDISFLIGNGINKHYNDSVASWDDLLLELWNYTNPQDRVAQTKIPLGISFTEFYDVLNINNNAEKSFESKIQKKVKDIILQWEANSAQNLMLNKIAEYNVPVLTTNFDELFKQTMGLEFFKITNEHFTDYYPWSSYYGREQLNSPLNGFGVWHINGMVKYHRSIKLGLSHYMGNVNRVSNSLHNDFEKYDKETKRGSLYINSWLNIIFNKSIFIVGLALDENEIFLRWLLIQRAKYFHRFSDRKKQGWYLIKKGKENISDGKRFFLNSVGFEILEVDSYDVMYNDIWE